MPRALRASVLALLVVTACGLSNGQGSGPLAPPSPPTAALAKWQDFPAHANPRPIIWFGGIYEHVNGFSDVTGKETWLCGKFVLGGGVQLPGAGPARATAAWPSGARGSYASIGAEQAFKALLAHRQNAGGSNCATAAAEVITDVRWGAARFATDRGRAQISAWLFDVGAVNGELGYPALDPSAYWGGGMTPSPDTIGGRISGDGLTLTIGLVGGPETPGPCGIDYAAAAAESETAVAVAISSRSHGGQDVVCDLVGYPRTVTVHLSAPLGGRVLLDSQGNPGDVCPEKPDC